MIIYRNDMSIEIEYIQYRIIKIIPGMNPDPITALRSSRYETAQSIKMKTDSF